MAHWHIRIRGTPWCCCGDPESELPERVRAALLTVCCRQASKADALSLKVTLAEMGYAEWDEIEVVASPCELKEPPEQVHSTEAKHRPLP